MCLPDFQKFEQINEESALTGYRNWRLSISNPIILISESREYKWDKIIEGPHEVLDSNSGIYAYYYNNYYYNNNNYYYYYYNNYYYNNYYNYNNYYIGGIIKQYGNVAIHSTGQRSEYAKIDMLFTIRESDAQGPLEFIDWIKKFNLIIERLSKKYDCKTIARQDFNDNMDLPKL